MLLGCRHYSTDGKFVTVASGRGDPKKDILVDVFKDWSRWDKEDGERYSHDLGP
jgi:hypothetical protein